MAYGAATAESDTGNPLVDRRRYADKRAVALVQEREPFLRTYRQITDFMMPRRGRYLLTDKNRDGNRERMIVNPHARLAARTLAAGMMAGITSPARPWFRLATPDPAMMEVESVKWWLDDTEARMREVFSRSNLYNALQVLYLELGLFGTAPLCVLEDEDDVIRCYPYTAGSYCVAQNARLLVDTFYHEFRWSVRQVVEQFGLQACSRSVQDSWKDKRLDLPVDVCMLVEPNRWAARGKADSRNMPFVSLWWEKNSRPVDSEAQFLRVSGYREFPVMCPRWDVSPDDDYGTGCGHDALGDVKALQVQEKRKAQAIDKHVDPPMVGHPELQNKRSSLLPGDVTFVSPFANGQAGFAPAYAIKPDTSNLLLDIEKTEQRISRTFYEDLFLMLANSDRRQITAREIEERHEEKLLMLGPVLERLNSELLDPLIERTFSIMLRRGLINDPPEELGESDGTVKVEYISVLAQAQKLVGIGAVERLFTFGANMAAVNPDALDKLDFDQGIDEYGNMLGTPARLVRSDDAVARIRAQKAQQAQMQQMAMAAQPLNQAAGAVKNLAQAPTGPDGENALTDVLAMAGAA